MRSTARAAAETLSAAWGTDVLAPWDMFGAMVMVRLPPACAGLGEDDEAYPAHAKFVQDTLFHTWVRFADVVARMILIHHKYTKLMLHAHRRTHQMSELHWSA